MRTSISEQENESHRDAYPCSPGKFGRLSVEALETSGEREFLLPCIGRWSPGITHLTGVAHLRYLKDDKEISVIVRNPANR